MADKPLTAEPALTTAAAAAAGAGVNTGSLPPLLRLVRFPLLSSCLCVGAAGCALGTTGWALGVDGCAVGVADCAVAATGCTVGPTGCAEKTLAAA